MRGTIIMWSGERGVVHAGGRHYDFDINHWHGAIAPAPNMTVDIETEDGRLTSLTPVSEADLAKEKLAAVTGEGGKHAKAIFAIVGRDVAIAYGVFFILAFFVSVTSGSGIVDLSITLRDLLSGKTGFASLAGSGGKGTLLALLATATVAVPYLWRHKLAPLAFAVPLVLTLYAFWPLYEQHRAQQEAMQALGELGRMMDQVTEQMGAASPLDALGVGAYLLFATVIYLAVRGVMRAFGR